MDISNPKPDAERIAKANAKVSGSVYFKDTLNHWAINDIAYLAGKKVLSGYPDETFRPDGYITRAEFSKILAEAMKLESSDIVVCPSSFFKVFIRQFIIFHYLCR